MNPDIYEIKNNRIILKKWEEDGPVIQIPETIDGLPVTELGEYIFSGKNCQEIYLPDTVKKIGRYGFYNCRKLKYLSFSDSFLDIGSGAFTGCHHIGRLETAMKGQDSGLKEILSEIREELCVRMTGEIDAVLWFPEYYEEGVENTPARILMTQVHGSGIYYRNCFQGKKFNFMEYDQRFEMACAQESERFLLELVTGRLYHPWGLTSQAKEQYEAWLKAHDTACASLFIKEKREEELEWLLGTYPVKDREQYHKLLVLAQEKGTPSMVSVLMDYQKKYFPVRRRSFDL